MSATITLDKNQLKKAGIDVSNLKHPSEYNTSSSSVTTSTSTENTGRLTSNLSFSLGPYISIKIEADTSNMGEFSIVKTTDLSVETYTYTTASKNIIIDFNIINGKTYLTDNTFTIPNTNGLKFVYYNDINKLNTVNITSSKYTLTVGDGNISIAYPADNIDNTTYTPLSQDKIKQDPVDELRGQLTTFFFDFILDASILIFLWLIILQFSLKWAVKSPDEMYPLDFNSKPFCVENKYNFKKAFKYNIFNDIQQNCKENNTENELEIINDMFAWIYSYNEENINKFKIFSLFSRNIHDCYKAINKMHGPFYGINKMLNTNSENYKLIKSILFCGILISLQQSITNAVKRMTKTISTSSNIRDKFVMSFINMILSYFFMFGFPLFIIFLLVGWLSNLSTSINFIDFNDGVGWLFVIYFTIMLFSFPYMITLGSILGKRINYNKNSNRSNLNEVKKKKPPKINTSNFIFIVFLFIPIIISLLFSFGTLYNLVKSSFSLFNEINLIKPYIYSLIVALFAVLLIDISSVDHKYLVSWTVLIIVFMTLFITKYNK